MNESTGAAKNNFYQKIWAKWLAVVLIVALIGGGGAGYYFNKKKNDRLATNLATFVPRFDTYAGKAMQISALGGGAFSVIDENKVQYTLTIPAGSLSKDTAVGILPLKSPKNLKTAPGIYIFPSDTVFLKPATITIDFSQSTIKNENAPKKPAKKLRTAGDAHVYRVNQVTFDYTSQLVARASETNDSLTAEVLGNGIYVYSLDGHDQVEVAKRAFTTKKKNVLSVIEAATTLLANKQKLDDKQIKLANGAINRIAAAENPDPIELYAAMQLNSLMREKKIAFTQSALADVAPGLFKYSCKLDPSWGPDQLYSFYKSAEAAGQADGAESCMKLIRQKITPDIQKVLDEANPTYAKLEEAERDVILFELGDDFLNALNKKERDKAVREANDLLKDEKTGKEVLTIALQNVQRYADGEADLISRLQNRINGQMENDVQKIINDPYATVNDLARAMGQNEFNDNEAEKQANQKQLEEKLDNKIRDESTRALGDNNTDAGTLTDLANAAEARGLSDLAKMLRERAKDAPPKKQTAIEEGKDAPERPVSITDVSELNAAAKELEGLGLKTFDQPGLNAWADDIKSKLYDAANMAMAECGSLGNAGCLIAAGLARWFGDEINKAIKEFAEEVGEVQTRPEDGAQEYDGSNENDRISGACIGKNQAATMKKTDADKYTLCPGVTRDDFEKPLDEGIGGSGIGGSASSEPDPDVIFANGYNRELCLQYFSPPQYPDWYCQWIEEMVEYNKSVEAEVAKQETQLKEMQAAAEAQAAQQNAAWDAESQKALDDYQAAGSTPSAVEPSAPVEEIAEPSNTSTSSESLNESDSSSSPAEEE